MINLKIRATIWNLSQKSIWFILLIFVYTNADILRFVFVPFKNETGTELNQWVSCAIPQLCFIKLHNAGIHLWEPNILGKIDSSLNNGFSDSVLARHHNRWGWDAAIGGSYRLENDSLQLKVKLLWFTGKGESIRVDLNYQFINSEIDSICSVMSLNILNVTKYGLTKKDSIIIRKKPFSNLMAFQTYASGLWYELHDDNNSAVTAYNRAVELEPELGYAWCNLSNLYDKNGNYELATKGFRKIDLCGYKDDLSFAYAADFFAERATPSEAMHYIEDHKNSLERTPEGQMAIGKGYISQGDYQRAIAILTQAIANRPSNLDAEFALGSAYLLTGEYQKAADLFNELIKYRPDYLRYYSFLGAAYRNAGRLMESSMVLEAALKIDPRNTMILVDLSHTYFKLLWYQKASQLLQTAIDIDPQFNIAYVNLGVVYWYEGRKAEAKKCFQQAKSIPLSKRAAFNNIGNIFCNEKSYRKAIRAYKKADRSGKKNIIVQYNLAISNAKIGRYKKALHYYNELLNLSPDRTDILFQAAIIAEKVDKNIAEKYYRKILAIYPYNRDALFNLTKLLVKNKKYEDAIKPIETYLEHFSNDKDVLSLLCSIYQQMGWYEVAIMKYNSLIRDYPDAAEGYWGVAQCMYDLIRLKNVTNYDQTIYALKQASDHLPDNPEPDLLAGTIYLEYKKYRELALDHFQKALTRSRNSKETRLIQSKIDYAKKVSL